jgi:predicted  nucleic acid-binding Zn-ribbon protein
MSFRLAATAVIAVLVSGATATVSAQTSDAESVKALRELVAEVRSLRATIEQYANAQIQAQAVGELLSVQQRRVADVTMRLDQMRRELDGISSESRRLSAQASDLEESLRVATDPKLRMETEMQQRALKQELERHIEQEQTLRSRETDLVNSLVVEEAKWNDLVERMNQWLRRDGR